jgi:PAS domain S-box-containing protein
MHGYLPEELLSLKIMDLDVADNLTAAPSRFDAILKGEWIGGVVNHMKKDGSVFPVDFHAGLLELDGHNYVFSVIRDISERKKAEDALKESEEKYRTILENIQDLIYRTDLKGNILMVSPAGARLAGYDSPDELVGMDVSVIHVDPEKRTQLLADLTVSGAVYDYPLTLKSKDGSIRYGLTNSHFYRDAQGTVLGVEGIIHDITVLRKAEDALRMANKKLTLLSGITRHDIKNQLMALKSFIYLSKDNLDNPGQLAGYLNKEAMIADTIERQINFTHDYENLGVKSPAWQNIDAIVNSAVSQHPLREIRIETVCPGVEIYADPLLEKVFFNLIDNALKYGGQNLTSIRITSEVVQNGLVISVRDDGGGIPADDKKKLFERGFGHHTGLGLFLSREILSITGITITETGEPGKGARFEILVPNGGYRSGDAAGSR